MKQIQTAAFQVPEYEVRSHVSYRPRIRGDQVRLLWLLKLRTKKPMTVLVREALEPYLHEQLAAYSLAEKGGDNHGAVRNSRRRKLA